MVLQCGTCGGQVKDTTARFCNHCGAKMDGKGKNRATQDGAAALISPVGEAGKATALPVIYCAAHPRRKVDGFCQQCQELVCLTCVTQQPRLHESCGEPLGLEDLLAMNDPFKDQRKQLFAGEKAREKVLKDIKCRKTDIQARSKAEVCKVNSMMTNALKVLDETYKAEVQKLTADRDRQKSLVQTTAKTKITHIEQTEKAIVVDLQQKIDSISADLLSLKAADQNLAATFSALILVDQVTGSKEARQLLSRAPNAPAPAPLPSATASDEAELRGLADLTLEVTAKKSGAGASQSPADLTRHVAAKRAKPKKETRSDVALTGPNAVFAVGSRVVVAPGRWSYPGRDDGGPGTITEVRGNGTAYVRWDASGQVAGYYGIGLYHLKLVKPA